MYASWQDPVESLKGDKDKVLANTGRHIGNLQMALLGKVAAGTTRVATECQGVGSLTVDAGSLGTFTELCSAHPDGRVNAFESPTPRTVGPLKVTPAIPVSTLSRAASSGICASSANAPGRGSGRLADARW